MCGGAAEFFGLCGGNCLWLRCLSVGNIFLYGARQTGSGAWYSCVFLYPPEPGGSCVCFPPVFLWVVVLHGFEMAFGCVVLRSGCLGHVD